MNSQVFREYDIRGIVANDFDDAFVVDLGRGYATLLHQAGIKVVCYMDAGTYEPDRPDSASFPASLKGAAVQGWPGELWLDVRPAGPDRKSVV